MSKNSLSRLEFEFILTAKKMGLKPTTANASKVFPAMVQGLYPEIAEAAERVFSIQIDPAVWADLVGQHLTPEQIEEARESQKETVEADERLYKEALEEFGDPWGGPVVSQSPEEKSAQDLQTVDPEKPPTAEPVDLEENPHDVKKAPWYKGMEEERDV